MAGLPMIETGYKPEFGLGALYQGFNAANSDMSAQEELLKQFLANQREQSMQPLDINIRGMESDRATQARSPEMLQAYKDIYLAQRDQTKASGDKARELSALDIATGKQDFQHKQAVNELIAKLDALKAGGDGGQIGFPMQGQERQTSGFNWKIPSEVQQSRDADSLSLMQQEQQQYPNDPALATDIANRKKTLTQNFASPVQQTNANNSPLVPQPPVRNGGITQGSPEYERVMQALVDQPELRSKLIIGDQRYDSSEFNKMLDVSKAEKIAAARGDKGGAGKDPFMEWNKLAPAKRAGILEYAKQLGINPITRQPIQSEAEQLALDKMYEQDVAMASQASPEAKTAGKIDLPKLTEGQIPTTPIPQTRTRDSAAGQPKLPSGWTLK